MTNNKFTKSVSFNTKNVNDQNVLKHIKKRNFSGYVKKLILADMRQKGVVNSIPEEIATSNQKETTMSRIERLQVELSKSTNNVDNNSNKDPNS